LRNVPIYPQQWGKNEKLRKGEKEEKRNKEEKRSKNCCFFKANWLQKFSLAGFRPSCTSPPNFGKKIIFFGGGIIKFHSIYPCHETK